MLASEIPAHERDFAQRGMDSEGKLHRLRPLVVEIPGDNRQLTVIRCQVASGDPSFYYNESFRKERIVLHFTAGFLQGDIATLTQANYHVSVPFVVARDGTIYNLWSSSLWSYHLGKTAVGGNTPMSQLSVAIELSNIGPLTREGNQLYSHSGTPYCGIDQEGFYMRQNYRGYEYYAAFTEAQYDSLIDLLRYLTGRFNIPRQFLSPTVRYDVRPNIASFFGIVSHANFRTDKFDIGPAFEWDRVIAGVTS